jgi:hypothetical protein
MCRFGHGGQMKEERLICQTTPKLSAVTQSCLKTKLQIYTAPEMAHTFCGCNTEIIVEVKCNKSLYDKFSLYKFGWRKWDDYKADLTTWWTMQK